MLYAVMMVAMAGSVPVDGGVTASPRAVLDAVCVGGPVVAGEAQARIAFLPQGLPMASLSTGRIETQETPPAQAASGGGSAAKALPSAAALLPGEKVATAVVGVAHVRSRLWEVHPWRPG